STRRPDTASKCWYHVPKSPSGFRPAAWNWSATKRAASSHPGDPVRRPSSLSSARNFTSSRNASAVISTRAFGAAGCDGVMQANAASAEIGSRISRPDRRVARTGGSWFGRGRPEMGMKNRSSYWRSVPVVSCAPCSNHDMEDGAMRFIHVLSIAALIGVVSAAAATVPPQAAKGAAANRYIGAARCKNCHAASESGDQFNKWKQEKHAKAFETLATDAAKKMAKEKGVDDPQKADACMKCHATAWSEPAEHLARGFEKNLGVQCETCHGPGEKHMKSRLAAAA